MSFSFVKKIFIVIFITLLLFNTTVFSSSAIIGNVTDVNNDIGPGFDKFDEDNADNGMKELLNTVIKNLKLEKNYVVLINHFNSIPLDYVPPLTEITGGQKLHSDIAPIVEQILKDAKKENIKLVVVSGYRSSDRQNHLFMNKIKKYKEEGIDENFALQKAISINPIPGTSEHQSGLCMDIVDANYKELEEKQEETEGYKWMLKHCSDYGFILRYPKNKTGVTGIIYEPWHFRYVGVDLAKYLTNNDLTLEEFYQKYK